MLETLKALCALPGVSGCEDAVREYILAAATAYVDRVATDPMGNLMLLKKGAAKKAPVMLCAHMDEVGLMVTDICPDGSLRFGCIGGIDRRVLPGKRVFVGEKQYPAVVACPTGGGDRAPKAEELWLDLGLHSREEAKKVAVLGDFVSFAPTIAQFGDRIKAKALDDRLGCAVL